MKDLEQKSGFLLVDKPVAWTSFDVVAKLRSITGIKKIGHAGTLDPFATGLLIVAVGRSATKQIDDFVKLDKVYETELFLGASSSTHDPEGEIVERSISTKNIPSSESIEKVTDKFIGKQKQIPPMYSAKKVGGKKLYELARIGKEIERAPEDIEILDIEILDYDWPSLKLCVHCSSGTYIRVLGADIGEALSTGAYLKTLRRIKIGKHSVEEAKKVSELNESSWEKCLI